MRQLLQATERQQLPVHLIATVYSVDRPHRAVLLKDSTGLLPFTIDSLPDATQAGTRLEIAGSIVVGAGQALVGQQPLIESQAAKDISEQVGTIFLQPGKRAFYLDFVQLTRRSFLNVFYSGPGFNHVKIPASALWRCDTNAPGQYLPGLNYEFYEGSWNLYPDLETEEPKSTGVISNFSNRIGTIANYYGIHFQGFIDIPQAGFYQFGLLADDNARLVFPPEVPTRVVPTGTEPLQAPLKLQPNQAWGSLPELVWAQTEGVAQRVTFNEKQMQVDLVAKTGHMRVLVEGAKPVLGSKLLGQRVRITGVAQAALTSEGTKVAGLLVTSGETNVIALDDSEPEPLPTMTTPEEVKHLSLPEARRHYPVHLRGMATYVFQGGFQAHIQGLGQGITVSTPSNTPPAFEVGAYYEVEGYTEGLRDLPTVVCQRHVRLGAAQWTEPLHPIWGQASSLSLDSQWVEIQGVVLSAKGHDLLLGTTGGELSAHLTEISSDDATNYLNATLLVRGTMASHYDQKNHLEDTTLQVHSPTDIFVLQSRAAIRTNQPAQPIASLRTTAFMTETAHVIKVRGQVLYNEGTTFYLTDGTNGLRFLSRDKTNLVSGDLAEVQGIPSKAGQVILLRYASARKLGHAPLAQPQRCPLGDPKAISCDSTRVVLEGTLFNTSTNLSEQALELRAGQRSMLARLNSKLGIIRTIPRGSQVRVTGVYKSQEESSSVRSSFTTAEILLTSPADVVVLSKPSWWTLPHTLAVVGAMCLGLAGTLVWIYGLRKRVEQRTRELREEIEGHHRTEEHLNEQTHRLREEIEERKRMQTEIEQIHRQLMEASRQAGQAEVAASVLHNVGNVLNSVNVSAGLLTERVRALRVGNLAKAAGLLQEHQGEMGRFLDADPRGRQLPQYLSQLAELLHSEQESLLGELKGLGQNIEHIKEIVAMQQTHAKRFGVLEIGNPSDLVEDALKLQAGSFQRHNVKICRQFDPVPPVVMDKHQMLQILVNLLQNAKHACNESGKTEKQVTIRIHNGDAHHVAVEISDNGMGIAPENMTRIFAHGFTTRKDGHGFGLHSAALAAKEMHGSLLAQSEGLGKGATFVLKLPLQQPAAPQKPQDSAPALSSPNGASATPDAAPPASAAGTPS